MIKIFGIGNLLLKDDGIGVEVAKAIEQKEQIQIYATEIFVEEALEQIQEDDYIIIIDAMSRDQEVGALYFLSFEECLAITNPKKFCHNRSLLDTLLFFYPSVKGELIGIQVEEIEYGEELSSKLEKCFPHIVSEVNQHIGQLVRKAEKDA